VSVASGKDGKIHCELYAISQLKVFFTLNESEQILKPPHPLKRATPTTTKNNNYIKSELVWKKKTCIWGFGMKSRECNIKNFNLKFHNPFTFFNESNSERRTQLVPR
jgi:hypothetical protein